MAGRLGLFVAKWIFWGQIVHLVAKGLLWLPNRFIDGQIGFIIGKRCLLVAKLIIWWPNESSLRKFRKKNHVIEKPVDRPRHWKVAWCKMNKNNERELNKKRNIGRLTTNSVPTIRCVVAGPKSEEENWDQIRALVTDYWCWRFDINPGVVDPVVDLLRSAMY